jgi:hypothetical protein
MPTGQLTISLDEYNGYRDREVKFRAQVAALTDAVEQARLGAEDSETRQLLAAFLVAMEIVGFSLATFTPLTVRAFPYAALRSLAKLLPDLPGVPLGLRETWKDLLMSADEYESWEKTRAEGKEQERLREDNLARSVGNTHALLATPPGR